MLAKLISMAAGVASLLSLVAGYFTRGELWWQLLYLCATAASIWSIGQQILCAYLQLRGWDESANPLRTPAWGFWGWHLWGPQGPPTVQPQNPPCGGSEGIPTRETINWVSLVGAGFDSCLVAVATGRRIKLTRASESTTTKWKHFSSLFGRIIKIPTRPPKKNTTNQ